MSVVVYHDGVMAADSRAYSGDAHSIGYKRKIHRLKEGPFAGSLLGICSNVVGLPEEFKAWLERGASREDHAPDNPSFEAILVKPNGEAFFYNDAYFCSGPLDNTTFTLGSGKKYALGALKMGASITEAIEIAKECDIWCGGPVVTLPLHETAQP
ncbi:putative HslV family peptidase protein [Rhizobium phage RHph_N1_10]|nr:putative HslV family peptidase protein [Rhizobium phage RHph_N1_10]